MFFLPRFFTKAFFKNTVHQIFLFPPYFAFFYTNAMAKLYQIFLLFSQTFRR